MKADRIERLDKYLQEETSFSRSQIQQWIIDGHILVNQKNVKKNHRLHIGDDIIIHPPKEQKVEPENIPLDIVYEDKYLAIINKPREMIVHPTDTIKTGTLVNALLYQYSSLCVNNTDRPGIVHRLDKDTTGLMLVAKEEECGNRLKDMIRQRKLEKKYLAIVHGKISESFVIERPIARDSIHRKKMCISEEGRYAKTIVKPLCYNDGYSLIEAHIITGRTHQIRVHLRSVDHPIVGDNLYGFRKEKIRCDYPMLHSYRLSFTHPMTEQRMEIKQLPDSYFLNIVKKCQLKIDLSKEKSREETE